MPELQVKNKQTKKTLKLLEYILVVGKLWMYNKQCMNTQKG